MTTAVAARPESDDSPTTVSVASAAQRKATRNLWVLLSLSVLTIFAGSIAHIQVTDIPHNSTVTSLTIGIPSILLLVTMYALVTVAKFVSPKSAVRAIGGRSWAYKASLIVGAFLSLGVFVISFVPLRELAEAANVKFPLSIAFPLTAYLTVTVLALSLVAMTLREHATADVAGSVASINAQATAVNLPDSALAAVRESLTRVSGETDAQRVERVTPFIASGRVDPVLDRIGNRDTTLVSVTPFSLEAGEPVRNTVQVGGKRLISADGCESQTYTVCWVADMSKEDGIWKLYGVRGAENQG